jgi:hypothetical protein
MFECFKILSIVFFFAFREQTTISGIYRVRGTPYIHTEVRMTWLCIVEFRGQRWTPQTVSKKIMMMFWETKDKTLSWKRSRDQGEDSLSNGASERNNRRKGKTNNDSKYTQKYESNAFPVCCVDLRSCQEIRPTESWCAFHQNQSTENYKRTA